MTRRTLVPPGHAVPNPGRVVALTFDDGPSPDWTPQVLDVLRRFNIKATFCTVGYNQIRHPELVRQVVAEGQRPAALSERHRVHPQDPLIEGEGPFDISDRQDDVVDAPDAVRANPRVREVYLGG